MAPMSVDPFHCILIADLKLRRDKYTIHSKAVVCQDVELKGDITIGSGTQKPVSRIHESEHLPQGTIVHPKATIFAIAGPIVIGSGCIIEEGAIIVNRCVNWNCAMVLPTHNTDQEERSHAIR